MSETKSPTKPKISKGHAALARLAKQIEAKATRLALESAAVNTDPGSPRALLKLRTGAHTLAALLVDLHGLGDDGLPRPVETVEAMTERLIGGGEAVS